MDKKAILGVLIKEKEERVKLKKEELLEAQCAIVDASGSKSNSLESDKVGYQEKIRTTEREISRCETSIRMLKGLSTEPKRTVTLGSLITIKNTHDAYKTCLVVPSGEMCPIPTKIDGQELCFLSMKSPVGQAILNLKEGEKATVQNQTFEVISVE